MIKRLAIHRFRGIRQGALDDFGKVNVLIGPNNSGKTAVLEMLYLASNCGRACNVLTPDLEPSAWPAHTLNRFDFLGEEPMPRLRERHGEPKKWQNSPAALTDEYSLDVILQDLPESFPFSRFSLTAPPEKSTIQKAFIKKDIHQISLFRLSPQSVTVPQPMMPPYFEEKGIQLENAYWTYLWENSWVHQWDRKIGIDHFAVWAIEGKLPLHDRVLLFDFHTVTRPFHKRFVHKAKDRIIAWEEQLAQSLQRVFPDFKNVKTELDDAPGNTQRKTGYLALPGHHRLAIDHFGDGARHAFKVLAGLTALASQIHASDQPQSPLPDNTNDKHYGLFLWEDPELFMHPARLGRLLEETINLITEKPIQIFITTQSLEVLAFFVQLVEENHRLTNDLRVFRLNLENGLLQADLSAGKGIASWFRFIGDPRVKSEEEIPKSPLYYLLKERDTNVC